MWKRGKKMRKYRKILVAIDGSESSMHALRESIKLAADENSLIIAVSVIPKYEGDLGSMWINNIHASIKKPCDMALAKAKEMAEEKRVLIRTICEEGEIYERIADLADAESCDLIVMGRKGMGLGRLEKSLVGSVTARVIGYAHKDVLVVPEGADIGWGNILLATDGSKYSEAAVDRAINFAKAYGGVLHVLSVVDIPSEFYSHVKALDAADELIKNAKRFVETIQKKAAEQGIKAEIFVKEGDASKAITDHAKDQKIDLIIIGSHGRTGLRRLLMGSTAEGVIGHSNTAVLVASA
jgi:nucleotide-binding universal stress UspA family protein